METYRTIHGRKRGSMTNDEASCVLHCPDAYGGIYGQKYGAALAHCFELLEQESCNEAVSRQAVLDACDQSINIFDATDRIKELPYVKPKVKECEDCVSREAVHNLIIPWLNDYLFDETREALETIDYKIEDLPSVTPQPKIGHWKKVNTAREYNSDAYECSECKYIIWTYKDADRKWNYCPKCGAKMEEEQDAH